MAAASRARNPWHRRGVTESTTRPRGSAMKLPHNAAVLVADGRKMLFLRNVGDNAYPNLVVERAEEHPNPPDREQKTDLAGRAASPGGIGQSTMGEVDFHELEEKRFAAEAAGLLRQMALSNDFESLIVIAPARTLGELRKHYHSEVTARLIGELGKDLTRHPISDIESAIKSA
jgi:protein required for attachment to host cells